MNAHPHSVQLATEPEAPALPAAAGFAEHLMQAAKTLLPLFEAGRSIDAAALRAAMEEAFGQMTPVAPGSGKTPMRPPRWPRS